MSKFQQKLTQGGFGKPNPPYGDPHNSSNEVEGDWSNITSINKLEQLRDYANEHAPIQICKAAIDEIKWLRRQLWIKDRQIHPAQRIQVPQELADDLKRLHKVLSTLPPEDKISVSHPGRHAPNITWVMNAEDILTRILAYVRGEPELDPGTGEVDTYVLDTVRQCITAHEFAMNRHNESDGMGEWFELNRNVELLRKVEKAIQTDDWHELGGPNNSTNTRR